MRKILCVIIILMGILFSLFNHSCVSNRIIHKDEVINDIENVDSKYDVISYFDRELCISISKECAIEENYILAIGYLADEYIKTHKEDIDTTGFVFKNNKPVNPEKFNLLLSKVKKENYVLYNNRTSKYHQLRCKYAEEPISFKIVPKSKLPKDAIPCKACHKQKEHKINKPTLAPNLTLSIGSIKVFLTDYTTNLIPTKECKTNVCKELVTQINNSKNSIDIAIYGYEKTPAIDFALCNALNRGVKIRLIYDIDTQNNNIYPDTKKLAEQIKESHCDKSPEQIDNPKKYTNSLMHNKFFIFDDKIVMTGSANTSTHDMCGFNSNSVIEITSPQVAQIYKTEFEQMFDSKFHELKSKIPDKTNLAIGNSIVSVYFSPSDKPINSAIVPLIKNAKEYIYIPTFLITSDILTNELIAAKKRGVDVKIIVDAVNAKSKASRHNKLRENGILVKTENYAGKLHSKSIIIDDIYTIIGSMNFSYSGNYKNDENLLVIKNKELAVFYRKFFEYLWSKIYTYWLNHDVSAESIYSIGSCSDGIDNDYDGMIDNADTGCLKSHNLNK